MVFYAVGSASDNAMEACIILKVVVTTTSYTACRILHEVAAIAAI